MRGIRLLSRSEKICIHAGWWLAEARDWCLRWIFAQHNARVIIDFEERMIAVICAASGNMMSKAYYDADVMVSMINDHINSQWDDGHATGRAEAFEEIGLADPDLEHSEDG